MGNVLVRGLPPRVHKEIQRFASAENLSTNQVLIRLITMAIEQMEREKEKREREEEAFRRIKGMREAIYRKRGLLDDSAKIIREFRDNRNQ